MSGRVLQAALSIAVVLIGTSQSSPVFAQDKADASFFEQVQKLERVAQIKRLEARIAKSEAKKARALADLEVSKARVEKARAETAKAKARRAWAQVEKFKANKKMQELTTDESKVVKAEKK